MSARMKIDDPFARDEPELPRPRHPPIHAAVHAAAADDHHHRRHHQGAAVVKVTLVAIAVLAAGALASLASLAHARRFLDADT